MKLSELSDKTDTPIPTIKFWMREGILPTGVKLNPTTSRYTSDHIERIELINVLRSKLDLPITTIATLTNLIDDPEVPVLRVMQKCQIICLGLTIDPYAEPLKQADRVARVREALGWPDVPSWAAHELGDVLESAERLGHRISDESLVAHARAFDVIASQNLSATITGTTRNRIAIQAVQGVTVAKRLERALSALAYASSSIASRNGPGPTPASE